MNDGGLADAVAASPFRRRGVTDARARRALGERYGYSGVSMIRPYLLAGSGRAALD